MPADEMDELAVPTAAPRTSASTKMAKSQANWGRSIPAQRGRTLTSAGGLAMAPGKLWCDLWGARFRFQLQAV